MKIPFTKIHYKPKTYVSHLKKYFGDSIATWKDKNSTQATLYGETPGFFRNITHLSGNFYIEIGKEFHGVIYEDAIEDATLHLGKI